MGGPEKGAFLFFKSVMMPCLLKQEGTNKRREGNNMNVGCLLCIDSDLFVERLDNIPPSCCYPIPSSAYLYGIFPCWKKTTSFLEGRE